MMLIMALAAITPALLVIWYMHSRDAYPEPPRLVWTSFLLGMMSAFVASLLATPAELLIGQVFQTRNVLALGFLHAFLSAAIPEECAKFAALRGYSLRRPEFNEPMDGLVYGVAVGAGFAAIENLLYVFHYLCRYRGVRRAAVPARDRPTQRDTR
jgi:RsiW-degrading membrane proteinase PrsW (M82 family)